MAMGWMGRALAVIGLALAMPMAGAAAPAPKTIDAGPFTIALPGDWRVVKGRSLDSQSGSLQGPGITVEFDYSPQGWSRGLPQSVRAYLDDPNAAWVPACPFCSPAGEPARDYTTEFAPIIDRAAWPAGDYLATLTRPDGSRLQVPVTLPDAVKYTEVSWTEDDRLRVGRAVSRTLGHGVNGVYLKHKASGATLVLRTTSALDEVWKASLQQAFATVQVKGW